jgi:hypothetical protein
MFGDVRVRQPVLDSQDDQASITIAQSREQAAVVPCMRSGDYLFERRNAYSDGVVAVQRHQYRPAARPPDLIDDAVAYRFSEIRQKCVVVPELETMELPDASHHSVLDDVVCGNRSAIPHGQVTLGELRQPRQI